MFPNMFATRNEINIKNSTKLELDQFSFSRIMNSKLNQNKRSRYELFEELQT
jgi:histone H3/H4